MTFEEYEISFRKKAQNAGYSEDEIIKCILYAKPLIEKKLPVIFNTSHLSTLVGYKKSYLKRASLQTVFFYRTFEISKKNGYSRTINEPLPSLKEIQQWILENILYEIPVSRFAKAYIRKRSIIDNVKYHKGQKKVVALDIQHFFSSISRIRIERLFNELGYSFLVSNLLSKLCCLEECLPQGAPTSPYLSNIILRSFDKEIENYCKENKIRYTRYADDITFSGDMFDEKEIIRIVEIQLAKESLKLNSHKTKIMLSNQRQFVTGLVINQKIQVPKAKRKELRQAIYYIQKYGLRDHLRKINCQKENYLKHILGIANFILFINNGDNEVLEYKQFIENLIEQEDRKLLKESIDKLINENQENEWKPEFVELMYIVPTGIICLLTAALYYDLTTFISSKYHIAIPKKSNVKLPNFPPIELFYWEDIDYNLGIIQIMIDNTDIQIYDIEKTVCDAVKYSKEIGKDISLEILKNYLKRKERNIVKLTDYSKKLGIYHSIMSNLLETLL